MITELKKQLNLENYFLLVIFLLPAYLFRFSIFGFPTNLWEVLSIAVIILATGRIEREGKVSRYEKKIIFLFLAIILGLILGMIKSGNYKAGLGIIKGWFIIPFLFAFLAQKVIKNKNKAHKSLYLSVVLVAMVALAYKFLGIVTYDGRLEAFFNSPNFLAMYLAPGIIIGAIKCSENRCGKLGSKIIQTITMLMILLPLYLTYSYSAWLSLAVALSAVFFLSGKFSKKYLIMSGIIFLAVVFLLKDTVKFNNLAHFDSRSSFASRMMIWKSSEKILSDNFIIGIGPGNFQEVYLEYQKYFLPYLEWAVPHPHNIFLAFWLYSGLIGIVSFLVIAYIFFKKSIEEKRLKNITSMLSLAIILYFIFHGLVDTTYFKNDMATIFWLAILL